MIEQDSISKVYHCEGIQCRSSNIGEHQDSSILTWFTQSLCQLSVANVGQDSINKMLQGQGKTVLVEEGLVGPNSTSRGRVGRASQYQSRKGMQGQIVLVEEGQVGPDSISQGRVCRATQYQSRKGRQGQTILVKEGQVGPDSISRARIGRARQYQQRKGRQGQTVLVKKGLVWPVSVSLMLCR